MQQRGSVSSPLGDGAFGADARRTHRARQALFGAFILGGVFYMGRSSCRVNLGIDARQIRRAVALGGWAPSPKTSTCVVPTSWVDADHIDAPELTLQMIPGYGNWTRPATAVPPSAFKLIGDPATVHATGARVHVLVGETTHIKLRCTHPNCRAGHVVLGARAIGPTPLRFEVTRLKGVDEFLIPFVAYDEGLYKLEIFMIYSNTTSEHTLCDSVHPHYEGIPLLSPPLKVDAAARDDPAEYCGFDRTAVPTCRAASLWAQPGRWRPIQGKSYTVGVPAMQWYPTQCRLPSQNEAQALQRSCPATHAVLIGDSLMDLQRIDWQQHWSAWSSSFHSTAGSLSYVLNHNLIGMVDADVGKALGESKRVVIVVNAGLHDDDKLCCPAWKGHLINELKMDPGWVANHTGPKACAGTFKAAAARLLVAIARWRAQGAYVAWRTTTASWMLWGNINSGNRDSNPVGSSHTRLAAFIKATGVLDTMIDAGIPIVDGWNTTLSRADHGQNTNFNAASIHFGPEVSNLHNKLFVLMAAEHFGCTIRSPP